AHMDRDPRGRDHRVVVGAGHGIAGPVGGVAPAGVVVAPGEGYGGQCQPVFERFEGQPPAGRPDADGPGARGLTLPGGGNGGKPTVPDGAKPAEVPRRLKGSTERQCSYDTDRNESGKVSDPSLTPVQAVGFRAAANNLSSGGEWSRLRRQKG